MFWLYYSSKKKYFYFPNIVYGVINLHLTTSKSWQKLKLLLRLNTAYFTDSIKFVCVIRSLCPLSHLCKNEIMTQFENKIRIRLQRVEIIKNNYAKSILFIIQILSKRIVIEEERVSSWQWLNIWILSNVLNNFLNFNFKSIMILFVKLKKIEFNVYNLAL